jgi:DNA-binding transcriptional ArsR family regulator
VVTYQDTLTALADPTRRNVFERLVSGPLSVAELAEGLPVSRPAVSQHLRVLKEAGLVLDRPNGTRRLYQLDPVGLGALRDYLDLLWEQSLAAFKVAAESGSDAGPADSENAGSENAGSVNAGSENAASEHGASEDADRTKGERT